MSGKWMEDRLKAQDLIQNFIKVKDKLKYANLNKNNEYLGWVYNFNIKFTDKRIMRLNLLEESDRFLLFALAIAWSRSGQWENAAFFVSYLKFNNINYSDYWLDEENIVREKKNRNFRCAKLLNMVSENEFRQKISFRKDIFQSMHILAKNWDKIESELDISSQNDDYIHFMNYLRNIEGLGMGSNRIYIKIPLILRELRCQNVFENIPGELCCVPDQRVINSCNKLGLKLPSMYKRDIDSLIKVSTRIYNLFGNLYDLPLFAYDDINQLINCI